MIRQDHGIKLDGVDKIRIIANDSSQAGFPNFWQLVQWEGMRVTSKLVPKSVTAPGIAELWCNNTSKSWTNHGTWQRSFRNSSRPQINVSWMNVNLWVSLDSDVVHRTEKVIPTMCVRKPTIFSAIKNIEWNKCFMFFSILPFNNEGIECK